LEFVVEGGELTSGLRKRF